MHNAKRQNLIYSPDLKSASVSSSVSLPRGSEIYLWNNFVARPIRFTSWWWGRYMHKDQFCKIILSQRKPLVLRLADVWL